MHPTTMGHAALWFADQRTEPGAYTMSITCSVTGPLTDIEITAALDRFIAAEPVLRVRMGLDEHGDVVQWFDPEPPRVDFADVTLPDPRAGLSEDDRVAEAVRPHLVEPFDVDGGPLSRLIALRAADRTILVAAVHHLLIDGVAQVVYADRLAAAVLGTPVPGSAAGYLALVEEVRAGERRAEETDGEYWAQRVGGRLGTEEWAGPTTDTTAEVVRANASPAGLERIDALAGDLGVSRFLVLAGMLHRALALPRTVVCAATSVRPRRGFEDTAGCFINQVPLIAEHHRGDSPADLLRREASGWRTDLTRRHRPLLATAHQHGPVRLDRVLTSYRPAANVGVLVYADGDRTVRADLFNRYYQAKTDLSVRFVPNAEGMEFEVEWAARIPSTMGSAFAETVRTELIG